VSMAESYPRGSSSPRKVMLMARPPCKIAFLLSLTLIPVSLFFGAGTDTKSPSAVSRSFAFTSVTHIPGLPPGTHRMRVWVPLPYEEASQTISQLKITTAVHYKIEREKEYGDQYVYLDYGNDDLRVPFDVRITFHADRFEHRVSLTPGGA